MRILWVLAACLAMAGTASAEGICLVPSPNGNNGTVDCDPINPQLHDNAIVGYSMDGVPCTVGSCLPYGGERADFEQYGWAISSSDTDPTQNTGPLPQLSFLSLWLSCVLMDGVAAVEMSIESTDPRLIFLAFNPLNGVLNAGTGSHLLLAVGGCPSTPFVAGQIIVLNIGPISVESRSWGGIKAMYR